MKWSELSIHTKNEAVEAISNILHEAGASGVVIEDSAEFAKPREDQYGEIYALNEDDFPKDGVIVKAYLSESSFLNETVEEIKAAITNLTNFNIDIGENVVSIVEVNEEDWATAWKQYYHPVKISERFTIVPTWEDYTPVSTDELIIELDPGMAFGTGTHPTTVMCLQGLEKVIKEEDTVVDIGTGSGVLSIGAALLGAKSVHALDLDEVAVRSAQENVALNKVEDKVEVFHGNLLDTVKEPADVVVANILAEIIMSFTDDAFTIVKPGGLYVTSGIIGAKRDDVKAALEASGFVIEEVLLMEDWVAIIARRPL
ncbi:MULTISPECIES: 50S ribosomal protein L11 methyltransferase [Lysinibacillus]|uniref:Ribosomal protein L11 methyltransferase n=1 Tax=Lysinibacillus fusiformis TaxID=28031 RepID=A0A2I0V195_9BACI|nr:MULTISPECIES: 50S ribosomal protein L11 methyltransferase [Lysinibacillus]KUF30944.1 ribosomal protein L11 methyltransferase [Lysinibacillus sp. F5]MEE3805876.1 50S ribosomal protein L11 methyltransferase [Lysinibacillus fusiformis]PKU52036.1 50S ribosomal protein L11 methyltransferase [Lysinibacillus fusiformis]WCH46421.1 50S ribosomal protein L11 methyltransferase [Lysinibacillus sp. OF-1]SCY74782.1 ribosomal protein L11 methyltransferase [Lysinibacillus sp. SG9]